MVAPRITEIKYFIVQVIHSIGFWATFIRLSHIRAKSEFPTP